MSRRVEPYVGRRQACIDQVRGVGMTVGVRARAVEHHQLGGPEADGRCAFFGTPGAAR
jgi:hypothetical protein